MKITTMVLAATAMCVASTLANAEAQEEPTFIYAAYYHCNSATVERADESVTKLYKAELDDMIKDRAASSWGWLGKIVGGEWARAGYITGPSLKAVLSAATALVVKSDGHPPVKAFKEACGSAEEYVWHVLAGSDPHARRGNASFSTYFVCDQSRESQADALVKRVLGPAYDKMIAAGKLMTWTWAEHVIGGKYRRLETMTAQTPEALIAVREALVAAAENDPLEGAMASICGSHQDVLWDVKDQGGP